MDVNLDVTLHNVVCCFHTKCHIKLKDFCLKAKNVEYVKEHGMVRLRLRKPPTTSSIWASGKISVTGAKSEPEAKQAARRVARILQRAGYDIKLHNYRVVNILAKCTLPFEVRLDSFANANRDRAQYEPELHPAVLVSMQTPKAVLHVFSTGSVTITTASIDNLSAALSFLYPLVVQHKIVPLPSAPATNIAAFALPPTSMPVSHISTAISEQNNNGKTYSNGVPRSQAQVKSEWRISRPFGLDKRDYGAKLMVDDIEEEEGLNGSELAHHCNFPRGATIVKQQPRDVSGGDGHFLNGDRRGMKRRMSCEESLGPADDLTSDSESEGS